MEDGHYYKSLTRNVALIIILVSFTPLILITGLIGYNFETYYRQKVLAHLQEVVLRHQQTINSFLEEKLSCIEVLAGSLGFEQLSNDTFLGKELVLLQAAYPGEFADLGVIDSRGIQTAYAGPFKLENADYSGAEWFREAMKRDFFISDVFPGLRREPHFIVAVKKNRGGDEWILRATIDFVAFDSLVENVRIGRTGSAFIMNRRGELQTKPRTRAEPDVAFLLDRFAQAGPQPGQAGQASGREEFAARETKLQPPPEGGGIATGVTASGGKEIVYILVGLKGGDWIMAFQQDEADAFADLRRSRLLALGIFFLGGLGIVLMTYFLSRKLVRHVERVDREKELMNEQVIEAGKLASIGELAAGIAHEINNPVAVMVEEAGWIEDLLKEEPLSESENVVELKRALHQISMQGERCKEITHKLLSFARKTDPTIRQVDVNALIREIISIFEQRSKFANTAIATDLAPDLPVIQASPSELQQVFVNLVNNAIDAVQPDGGTIEIRTKVEAQSLVIEVSDDGHGMPKAIMTRMFDPFFTTKPVGKGTGLGLSICYGIIKKLHGDISATSTVGAGTTFRMELPLPGGESTHRR